MLRVLAVSAAVIMLAGACKPAEKPAPTEACAVKPNRPRPFLKPANPLEQKVMAFSCRSTLETEAALADAFLASPVFVEVNPANLDPKTGRPLTDQIDMWMVAQADGSSALAIFTSKEALVAAFGDDRPHSYLSYRGADVLRFAGTGPIVVNPGLDPEVTFSPPVIVNLRKRALEQAAKGAGKPSALNLHDSGSAPAPLPR